MSQINKRPPSGGRESLEEIGQTVRFRAKPEVFARLARLTERLSIDVTSTINLSLKRLEDELDLCDKLRKEAKCKV